MKLPRTRQHESGSTVSKLQTLNDSGPAERDAGVQPPIRVLRIADVKRLTGLSRTTIWRLQCKAKFPASVVLLGSLRGWYESEVEEWCRQLERSRQG